MDHEATWEERWHPLRAEWVIVAAHRQSRPWIGSTVAAPARSIPYDPACYLCPGNQRSGGALNPDYDGVFVFDNDHPCVGPRAPEQLFEPPAPYRVRRADGVARVICFSPRHDATMAELPLERVAAVIATWQAQMRELRRLAGVRQVLIFENKGEEVGVSNPHPHGQLYATNFSWRTFETEHDAQRRYRRETGRALFADIIAAEQRDGRRILYEDDAVIAFVPYFARYAYEVYLAPKRRVAHIDALRDHEVVALARGLHAVTVSFDNLWRRPFPYVMPVHQAPFDDEGDFHCFIGFLPPLRRPDTLKFLAGPEIGGGNFLSDTAPEATAAALRAASGMHYRQEAR